ncbi:MAG: hypothetical protein V4558_12310 [Gemmatimonadota bacterium]
MKRFLPLLLLAVGILPPGLSAQAPRILTVTRDLLVSPDKADLSEAFNIAVSRRGEIVVPQPGQSNIKIFSPTGAMSVIGRAGEGPGEFRRVTRVGFVGDSLWVLDPSTARITLFGPDYKLLRSFPEPFSAMKAFQAKVAEQPVVNFFTQAVLPGGDLRALASMRNGTPKPAWAADIDSGASLFVRISATGEYQRRLAVSPPSRCSISYTVGKSQGSTRVPYCPERLSTDWDGALGLALVDVLGSGAKGATYRVTLIRETGDTLFSRAYAFTPIAITTAARDSAEAWDAGLRKQLPPPMAEAMPKPKPEPTYPPVRRVVLGRDNTVWLEMRTSAGGHRWQVLDPRGNVLGAFQLPTDVTLKAAERGTIWGLTTDEDGVQGVVRYKVGT